MNKKELKQVLKPLIKECIKEVIFEDGTLSGIISEVMIGMNVPLTEDQSAPPKQTTKRREKAQEDRSLEAVTQLHEHKKKMLDAIGNDAYNGVNIFEGTTPTSPQGQQSGPFSGTDPTDAGVDIGNIMGKSSMIWKRISEG